MPAQVEQLKNKLIQQLETIYQDITLAEAAADIADALIDIMRLTSHVAAPKPFTNHWSESDIILITYGDSIISQKQPPLKTLKTFLDTYLKSTINSVHILPFFPYSSDDGFSVIDYRQVNPEIGSWEDIDLLAGKYHLMFDAVVNHISRKSDWFQAFQRDESPYKDYFRVVEPNTDLSSVFRR